MQIALISLTPSSLSADIACAIQRAEMEVIDFSRDMSLEKLAAAQAYILLADSDDFLNGADVHALVEFLQTQNAKGKPILGLAYAAVLLVENGLVPGLYKHLIGLSMRKKAVPPDSQLRLSPDYQYNAFTRCLTLKDRWSSPRIAPLEFVIPPGLLAEIQSQGLDVFWYGEDKGIAAVANKAGNIMAMLAYPENGPRGDAIFNSLREHLASGFVEQVEPLCYWPRK